MTQVWPSESARPRELYLVDLEVSEIDAKAAWIVGGGSVDRRWLVVHDFNTRESRSALCACDSIVWVGHELWAASTSGLQIHLGSGAEEVERPLTLQPYAGDYTTSLEMPFIWFELLGVVDDVVVGVALSNHFGSGYLSEPFIVSVDRDGDVQVLYQVQVEDGVNVGLQYAESLGQDSELLVDLGWRNGYCQVSSSLHALGPSGTNTRYGAPDPGWYLVDAAVDELGDIYAIWGSEWLEEQVCRIEPTGVFKWNGDRWVGVASAFQPSRLDYGPDGLAVLVASQQAGAGGQLVVRLAQSEEDIVLSDSASQARAVWGELQAGGEVRPRQASP